ncbi:MAG: NAD(P)-dependent oxidoreductase [Phycisphaerales bacterium]
MQLAPGSKIAWIGTGVIGLPMAGHLLNQGYVLSVYTRTRARAQPLLERGATWADSPAAAAEGASAAISIVGYPEDVRSTHLGANGTLTLEHPPPFIIDMTTSRPSLAVEIHQRAAALGSSAIDAPVSGGDVGARNATLSIMVGADDSAFRDVLPIFDILGKTVVHQGLPGAGQHTKMVNQILVAASMIGACEGLHYAEAAGLDLSRVIESVGSGAAGSWTINTLGPRMIAGDFEPGFFVEHFVKDLGIALEEASAMHLDLPGLALAQRLYETLLKEAGMGRKGTQSLLLHYRDQM